MLTHLSSSEILMESIKRDLQGIKNDQIAKLLNYLEHKGPGQTNASFVRAYSKVFNIAESDYNCPHLYQYFKDAIEEYTISEVKSDLIKKHGITLIQTLSYRWANHKILTYCLGEMFRYLDRYYTKAKKLPPLFLAGVSIFNNLIFVEIQDYVQRAILDQIQLEREGSSIDIGAMKECLSAFVQMGSQNFSITKTKSNSGDQLNWSGDSNLALYQNGFEDIFMVETANFYEEKSIKWISSMGCVEYLETVKKAFQDEEKRLKNYLDASSEEKLMSIVTRTLVTENAKVFCNLQGTGCEEMLKNFKLNELKLLYSVLRKDENQFVHIKDKFHQYFETEGLALIVDKALQEDAIEFTKRVLQLKEKMDTIVEDSFDNNVYFQRIRDQAIQNFLNKYPYSAQYIASFCDSEMKKGLKGASEEETDRRLTSIVKLFVCLYDRDVFIKYYTRFLAKRLLDETSISDDAEQMMISKLKVECGLNLVRSITNMYQDKGLSEGVMREFQTLQHRGAPKGTILNVQILRNGCWPEQSSEPCMLHKELTEVFKYFEMFYLAKHGQRHLTILNNYGSLELGTLFCAKGYTLVVNPYQAAIILLFNENSKLNLQQIKESTHLTENTLKSNLLPLFNPKMKLFTKESSGKTINSEENISLSLNFSCTSIKINYLPKKVKKVESETNIDDKAIENERKFVVDSVIVRIAKGRKTIRHNDLMAEVLRQVVMFKPQVQLIKAQIESLIQREFLKRDDDDKSLYIYLP